MRFDATTFWQLLFSGAFLQPAWTTVWVTLAAMTIGIALGLVGGIAGNSAWLLVRLIVRSYVTVFRAIPALLQIVFWYDALAELTSNLINLPALLAGVLALGVNEGAYMTEIVRAGLSSIGPGQREAAFSLGLTRLQTLWLVVVPQALRVIVPPTGNQYIGMLKTTSLLFTIGVPEIFATGTNIYSVNFRYFEVLSVMSLWYLVLTGVLTLIQRRLEAHFGDRWAGPAKVQRGALSRAFGFALPVFPHARGRGT
jgi:polar amino acid transport system permease protein